MPHAVPCRDRLPAPETEELMRVVEVLGPMSRDTFIAMVDYGLSDDEIGRYFRLGTDTVRALRKYLNRRHDL